MSGAACMVPAQIRVSLQTDNVLRSLAGSAAIFGAEVIALRQIVHDSRTTHADAARAIVISAPILQIVSSTLLELHTHR